MSYTHDEARLSERTQRYEPTIESGNRIGAINEVTPYLSTSAGRDFFTGNMSGMQNRSDLNIQNGALQFNNMLPREGTLDFLNDSIPQRGPSEKFSVQSVVDNYKSVHFASPEQLKQQQITPDYYLNSDGQLVANSDKRQANPDGSAYIAISPEARAERSGGFSSAQRQRISDILDYWMAKHPGQPVPPELTNMMNAFDQSSKPSSGATSHDAHGGHSSHGGHRHHGVHRTGDGGHRHARNERTHPESAGSDGASSATQSLRGNNNAEKVYNYLIHEMGLSRAQAAGILGNLIQENRNFDPQKSGDHGHAIGIAQWNGDRKKALFAFAQNSHSSPTDLHTQLEFMKWESQHTEQAAFNALRKTNTPEQAALSFSKLYERPGNPMNNNRVANARMAFNRFGAEINQVASTDGVE